MAFLEDGDLAHRFALSYVPNQLSRPRGSVKKESSSPSATIQNSVTSSPADARVSPAVKGRTWSWPAMALTASASNPAQNREVANQATTRSVSTSGDGMLIPESATAVRRRSQMVVVVNRLPGKCRVEFPGCDDDERSGWSTKSDIGIEPIAPIEEIPVQATSGVSKALAAAALDPSLRQDSGLFGGCSPVPIPTASPLHAFPHAQPVSPRVVWTVRCA